MSQNLGINFVGCLVSIVILSFPWFFFVGEKVNNFKGLFRLFVQIVHSTDDLMLFKAFINSLFFCVLRYLMLVNKRTS